MSVRIGVDLKPLLAQRTGVGKYQAALMGAVLERGDRFAYAGFADRGWRDVPADLLDVDPAPAQRRASLVGFLRRAPFVHAAYQAARGLIYERTAAQTGAAFFHAFLYRPPRFAPLPFVPVIYDLSNKRVPQHHPAQRLRWMEKLDAHVAAAPVIHTISRFTRDEIMDVYGVPVERIHVIEPGVDAIFQSPASGDAALRALDVTARNYFLSVATIEPRKNLATLIRAFAALPTQAQAMCPLVLVGAQGWSNALPPETEGLVASGRVRFAGYVADSDLRDLYAGACAMAYASTYEGFGMPIAEALAAGAPVIASDIPPHREASAGAARFVDALDVDGWRQALSDAYAARYEPRGAVPPAFTWRGAAEKTIALYEETLRRIG